MTNVEGQGYSKEKALAATNLDITLDRLKNATQAWKKAGSPIEAKALNAFVDEYFKKQKTSGVYIVVDPAVNDTRTRPYSVENVVTAGKRTYTTFYQVKEAELAIKSKTIEVEDEESGEMVKEVVRTVDVVSTGVAVAKADKKNEAVKIMKELIEANKRNYTIELVKEETGGQKYASHGIYTPSKSAKLGKFLFYVND